MKKRLEVVATFKVATAILKSMMAALIFRMAELRSMEVLPIAFTMVPLSIPPCGLSFPRSLTFLLPIYCAEIKKKAPEKNAVLIGCFGFNIILNTRILIGRKCHVNKQTCVAQCNGEWERGLLPLLLSRLGIHFSSLHSTYFPTIEIGRGGHHGLSARAYDVLGCVVHSVVESRLKLSRKVYYLKLFLFCGILF